MKKYIFLLAMVVIFTGCETIEEEAVLDDNDIVNNGDDGGQEVYHLHFHIFGGEKVGKMVS